MYKTEILSPVGNFDMLTAAVRSGADAVYLGLEEFNARRNAENFTIDSLKEAVEFCHIRGVKVYLTLNIILDDSEIRNAVEQTVNAANLGVDGVITADIGFAVALKKAMPSLPIHASTQMTVHSPAAIKPLKELGFSRVVVSREMSREELRAFCKEAANQNIEVEAFVHGALCMCMSGQCLLSAMLGGRSGNRGLCAGPCRLPFSAVGGERYDLSLKDLSLVPYLNELKELGVMSFKIEGRMKRPEYVAAATAVCRQMLDGGEVSPDLNNALSKVFSRSGFTDGYYTGRLGKEMFGVRTRDDVIASDDAFAVIHALYRNERQSVAVNGELSLKENEPSRLRVSDGVNCVEVKGDVPEKALNRPIDKAFVSEKLSKTGATPYFFEKLDIELDDGLIMRVSELNALRRDALDKLSALRAEPKRRLFDLSAVDKPKSFIKSNDLKTVVRIDNINQLTTKACSAELVVVPIDISVDALPVDTNFAVELPRGISNEAYVTRRLEAFKDKGISIAFCGTLAATELARASGFKTVSDFGYNVFNSYAAEYHKEMGAQAIVLSSEMLLSNALSLSVDLPKGIISYGRLPLMLTRNCPIKNSFDCAQCGREKTLTDRKGASFPVRCRNGYSELLNSKVIWLADRKAELRGLSFEVLYFTDEAPERVDEVLDAYRIGSAPTTEFTRGLYYRGVF